MKICVIGCKGRMGSLLCELAQREGHEVFGIDKDNREEIKGFSPDVLVDFSNAECLQENLTLAKEKGVPILIATTGHSEENHKIIQEHSEHFAVFMASNLSVLFNLMLKIAKNIDLPLKSDVILEETHHKHKKDCPSGSAKELLKCFSEANRVKVISNRVGEVVGIHKFSVFLGHERLEITHTCESREVFCEGALLACGFIKDKKKGLYGMQDLIK